MPTYITIRMGDLELSAELNDTESAVLFEGMLPLSLHMNRWGDEYYGDCGIQAEVTSDAREVMEVGELAIWPPGSAFCIFFGSTPASEDERPRAASAVNPIGKIIDDPSPLKQLGPTFEATVEVRKETG